LNYQETLDYLYAQLPMFHRVGASAYKPSLDNTIALAEALGNPHLQFKSIHIAGTNGKGSSSHYLASIMQSSGYKTGLYTSPHLKDFRERIRISGEMIPEFKVIQFVESNLEIIEKIKPSFFELCVVMAFDYFAKEKVDIAVIEVGMGGRLDSTNIITPELSLITNISYDHTQFLGDTLPLIAKEKAGIIKKGVPVIVSQTQEECKSVFEEVALEKDATLLFADSIYQITKEEQSTIELAYFRVKHSSGTESIYKSSLTGTYQEKNLAGVLACVDELRRKKYVITDDSCKRGIEIVKTQTGLRGRWECIHQNPLAIADTGHNEDGIKEVLKQVKLLEFDTLHWVWGMVNDKDPDKVFPLLPKQAKYYFCKPNIPRGLDSEACKHIASNYELHGEAYASVTEAYQSAIQLANKNDLIIVGGSTFVVAEVL